MGNPTQGNTGAYREGASNVALERAKRLRKRANAFETLSVLIREAVKEETITKEQEEELWSLLIGTSF